MIYRYLLLSPNQGPEQHAGAPERTIDCRDHRDVKHNSAAHLLDCVADLIVMVTWNHHQQLSYMHDLELGALLRISAKSKKIYKRYKIK